MAEISVYDFMDQMHAKVGVMSYDHEAAAGTRFGQSTGSSARLDWRGRECDCSGGEIGALVAAGWTRYTDGFPESSGDMARWAVTKHPELLLWSHDGKGKLHTLDAALSIYGALWVLGGFVNGDDGHTGASDAVRYAGGFQTTESASSLGGMAHGSTARFKGSHGITHVFMAPGVDYHAGQLVKPRSERKKVKTMDKLIRDSRNYAPGAVTKTTSPTGLMTFHYTGTEARVLDEVEKNITKDMLALDGIENTVHDGQNYLIDRLRKQNRLILSP